MHRILCILIILIALGINARSIAEPEGIPCLSGFVRDGAGNPVVGGDLDFFNTATGVKLITPGDNTDVFGFYTVCVLPGVYDVTFEPPPGTRLRGVRINRVDLRGNIGKELSVTLPPGLVVSGAVTDASTGAPVIGADIDVDSTAGGRLFTPGDKTVAGTGVYRVVIPPGEFRFRVAPPPGSRLRGAQIDSVRIVGDATLPFQLEPGVLLSGRVRAAGVPASAVDVGARALTGGKIFVANNKTDIGGNYQVALPAGTLGVRFTPPRGSHLVAVAIDSVVLGGDARLDQDLATGVEIRVVVRDSTGARLAGADIDVKDPTAGTKWFTPWDLTRGDGVAEAVVPPGLYSIQVDPPPSTLLGRVVLRSVDVAADTTIYVELPEVARVAASGSVVDSTGAAVAGVEMQLVVPGTGESAYVASPLTDATGRFDMAVPLGTYRVNVIPPRGDRHVAEVFAFVPIVADSLWGTIVLDVGQLVDVRVDDEAGSAVFGADIDFIREADGAKVFTPHDNTGRSGDALVAVRRDVYTVVVTPARGSGLDERVFRGIPISSDTTLSVTLARRRVTKPPSPISLGPSFPNPFSLNTTMSYTLNRATHVVIRIFSVRGQFVREVSSGARSARLHRVTWDGRDANGQRVATGVYFVRLVTPLGSQTRKVVIVR